MAPEEGEYRPALLRRAAHALDCRETMRRALRDLLPIPRAQYVRQAVALRLRLESSLLEEAAMLRAQPRAGTVYEITNDTDRAMCAIVRAALKDALGDAT